MTILSVLLSGLKWHGTMILSVMQSEAKHLGMTLKVILNEVPSTGGSAEAERVSGSAEYLQTYETVYCKVNFSDHPLFSLENIYWAYRRCRRNKRNTVNALIFEKNLEENLVSLHEDLCSRRYIPGRSLAFSNAYLP